jgi:hypothetical protein
MKAITISTLLFLISFFTNAQEHTRIEKGKVLYSGRSIYSKNGTYKLTMQKDGNLVLSRIYSNRIKPIWATSTDTKAVEKCSFQSDGNLVLYGYNGKAIWASSTDRRGEYLLVQNDGNVVIYDANYTAIWATNTDEKIKNKFN